MYITTKLILIFLSYKRAAIYTTIIYKKYEIKIPGKYFKFITEKHFAIAFSSTIYLKKLLIPADNIHFLGSD